MRHLKKLFTNDEDGCTDECKMATATQWCMCAWTIVKCLNYCSDAQETLLHIFYKTSMISETHKQVRLNWGFWCSCSFTHNIVISVSVDSYTNTKKLLLWPIRMWVGWVLLIVRNTVTLTMGWKYAKWLTNLKIRYTYIFYGTELEWSLYMYHTFVTIDLGFLKWFSFHMCLILCSEPWLWY